MIPTARLRLRDPRTDDATVLAAYHADPRYLEHYPEPPDAVEIVRLARAWAQASPRANYQLVVERADSGAVIGCAGVRTAGLPDGQAEVGVELDPQQWGAGYAREALGALIAFAHRELSVRTLHARTEPGNRRAQRMLRALGFDATDDPRHFRLDAGS